LPGLLATLADAAHHDVFNRIGIDPGARNQRIKRRGGKIDRVNSGQSSAAAAAGGADCINDIGGSHRTDSFPEKRV
jgi:hypothetical protein